MDFRTFTRNELVTLNIPASRPIKTLDGNLHEAGQAYKFLGYHGTCLRLSRATDSAKLIINSSAVSKLEKH